MLRKMFLTFLLLAFLLSFTVNFFCSNSTNPDSSNNSSNNTTHSCSIECPDGHTFSGALDRQACTDKQAELNQSHGEYLQGILIDGCDLSYSSSSS